MKELEQERRPLNRVQCCTGKDSSYKKTHTGEEFHDTHRKLLYIRKESASSGKIFEA
jgi:hypothetical protein